MLKENFYFGYLANTVLFSWIIARQLAVRDFAAEQRQWTAASQEERNFFSDTRLLLVYQDVLVLAVADDEVANFYAKAYNVAHQTVCQKIFGERKNIILVEQKHWDQQIGSARSVVLLPDEQSVQKSLSDWLS